MPAKAKEQQIKLGEIQSRAADDPFFLKLASTPKAGHDSWKCLKPRVSCWTSVTKNFWGFILFHVLNVVVTIVGVVFVALMVANAALAPGWFVLFAYGALVIMLGKCISTYIRPDWLQILVFLALLVLWSLSGFNNYTLAILIVIPVAACWTFFAELLLYYLSYGVMTVLVKKEVDLAKFVHPFIDSNELTGVHTLSPDACVDRFEFPSLFTSRSDVKLFSSHFVLTRRVWALALYYAVLKLLVGMLSATLLVLVLVQPVAAICTLGHDPFIGNWIDGREHSVTYSIAVILLWLLGVSGLQAVARLSVKWTVLVCGPWASEDPAQAGAMDPAVRSTPDEAATTCFTQT